MAESNYDILKIQSGASKKDIRKAYRSLVLKLHSDRGGDDEQFKRIQRAYEDLRIGKKYPDSIIEKKEKAKFYSGDSDADQRRKNLLLSQDISREMKTAKNGLRLLTVPELLVSACLARKNWVKWSLKEK